MSRESGEQAQKISDLRTRFPDVDCDLIQDMLAQSRFDASTAANMLIQLGCKEATPVPSRVEPRAHFPSAAPLPVTRPPVASVFDAFKPEYVSRALAQAKGAEEEALDFLLSLGEVAIIPSGGEAPPPRRPIPSAPLGSNTSAAPIQPARPPPYPSAAAVPSQSPAMAAAGVPLAMLSTVQQIQHAEAESRAMYERDMRAQKIHVFVDLSNVSIGAQIGPDGKRDISVRIDVPQLVQCVHQGRDVKGGHVITSVAGKLGSKQPAFIRDWEKVGYVVRVQERRGGSEQLLDEVLMSAMQETILKFSSSEQPAAGSGQRQHRIVLLSGDGNTNHNHHSFAETIQLALGKGMFVEIWAWRNSVSQVYTKRFMEHYGGSFSVCYFDDHRARIVCARAASAVGGGISAAAADASAQYSDDDDWMFCPITFHVISNAAATKFAPKRYYERKNLEDWVKSNGSCPLTRQRCSLQDIISCADEMRSRMQAHARQLASSASPPAQPRQKEAAPVPAAARPKDAAFAAEDTLNIPPNKVPALIGHKGVVISGIESKSGTRIHVGDDGAVHIRSGDTASVRRARELIDNLINGKPLPSLAVHEIPVGATYSATVVAIKEFGCFVRLPSGQDSMVHISELDLNRVAKVEDVVKIGDVILVKCIGKDGEGRAKMSRKAAMKERGGGAAGA